jgi:LPPG:FO 2-phospho-L-lactate transferase
MNPANLSVIVNVGDDEDIYGTRVCADLDTVVYTLAGIEGPQGWGIAGDTFNVMEALAGLGVNTTFRLGDRDLALCLRRTNELRAGAPLSEITAAITQSLGIATRVLPASDDEIRTRVRIADGTWLDFQDYFVVRGHRDSVDAVRYDGDSSAQPAPGVLDAIVAADLVIVAPSNPPLSIWPILAIAGIRDAIMARPRTVAISPLFAGKALKGPADRVMAGLGLPSGNVGVMTAYEGFLTDLVIDQGDAADVAELAGGPVGIHAMDTLLTGTDQGAAVAAAMLNALDFRY